MQPADMATGRSSDHQSPVIVTRCMKRCDDFVEHLDVSNIVKEKLAEMSSSDEYCWVFTISVFGLGGSGKTEACLDMFQRNKK